MQLPDFQVLLFLVCPTVFGVVSGVRAKGGWLRGIGAALVGIVIGVGIALGAPFWVRYLALVIENGGF